MAGPAEVQEKKSTWWVGPLVVIVLFVVGSLFFLLGSTVNTSYNSPDFTSAALRGTATVRQCETKGPIGLVTGFGHYQLCDISVDWDNGSHVSFLLNQPGLFRGLEKGDTFRIGVRRVATAQHVGADRTNEYSREDLAHHGWATAIGVVFSFGGIVLLLIVVIAVLRSIKKALFG